MVHKICITSKNEEGLFINVIEIIPELNTGKWILYWPSTAKAIYLKKNPIIDKTEEQIRDWLTDLYEREEIPAGFYRVHIPSFYRTDTELFMGDIGD